MFNGVVMHKGVNLIGGNSRFNLDSTRSNVFYGQGARLPGCLRYPLACLSRILYFLAYEALRSQGSDFDLPRQHFLYLSQRFRRGKGHSDPP